MRSTAVISPDGKYRYRLDRESDDGFGCPLPPEWRHATMAFIMVNPSTADASVDDPTIRRCLGYAKREGCGHLIVGNLFAYRSTDVNELMRAYNRLEDVPGVDNDLHLRAIAKAADIIVLGWGPLSKQPAPLRHRWTQVVALLAAETGDVARLKCLGVAKDGHPRHPLYMPLDAPLETWRPPGTPRSLNGQLSSTWGS